MSWWKALVIGVHGAQRLPGGGSARQVLHKPLSNRDLHALRRINYIGATFRTRSREEVALINQLMMQDLQTNLAANRFRIPIDREFPLAAAAEAQAYMAANQHFGKILLTTNT